MSIISTLRENEQSKESAIVDDIFGQLIQGKQYVGDVYYISYEMAHVQIHDNYRQKVGGIPSLCFLIATRISPGAKGINYQGEDNSIILLRVMDSTPLPSDAEAERVRVEVAQKVAGELDIHWDESKSMDAMTHNLLSFAGVKCRVIGTFFVDITEDTGKPSLQFGSDLSNYYPNRGLKVYKPNGDALATIINYISDTQRKESRSQYRIPVGEVRYASTNRAFQEVSNVKVLLSPTDLLGQKTALFGMTRTGKSNTTKIIIQSVFKLRYENPPLHIGQIVFDPDGEYANENEQDANRQKNPTAIKNVWRSDSKGRQEDVVTYGLLKHPNDPNRRLMLLNFYESGNLQIGKQIIDAAIPEDSAQYLQGFRQVVFEEPDSTDRSASTRFKRQVLVYYTLLYKAGFEPPSSLHPSTKGLFSEKLIEAMKNSNKAEFISAATILNTSTPSWGQLSLAFERLNEFLSTDSYKGFDRWYVTERQDASGDNWADPALTKLLMMYKYPNGTRQMGKVQAQHTTSTTLDYAAAIYEELVNGHFVIVDQSSGDAEINKSSARRIMQKIFEENRNKFREGKTNIPEILVYVEEAHNLLPGGSDLDLGDIWVRTAKEGAKYHIGLVYATQEVSSIQRNILKNTANWFIGHLNNTDETKELCKYYDFVDFEPSIRRAPDRGFLRVKTLSNRFTISVQIRRFEV